MAHRLSTVLIAADSNGPEVIVLVLAVGLAIAAFALMVAALVSIVRSPRLTTAGKALWILIVLIAQLIGPIVWFAWGRHATGSSLYAD